MEQEVAKNSLESFFDKTQSYAQISIELTKLKGLNATTNVITVILARLCVFIVALLFFVIVSIGIALWLGELLGELYYGFFIVAGFYLLIGLIFYFFLQKWIEKPFGNLIVSKALQ